MNDRPRSPALRPPPHPATVAQPRMPFGPAARPPHAATTIQRRTPHAATIGQSGIVRRSTIQRAAQHVMTIISPGDGADRWAGIPQDIIQKMTARGYPRLPVSQKQTLLNNGVDIIVYYLTPYTDSGSIYDLVQRQYEDNAGSADEARREVAAQRARLRLRGG